MRALVFAGDEGARLRPLTVMRPTAMTEVLNVPFIDIIMKNLAEAGVTHVSLLSGYMPNELYDFLEDGGAYGFR